MALKKVIRSVYQCELCGRIFNAYDLMRNVEVTPQVKTNMFRHNRTRAKNHARACELKHAALEHAGKP